MWDQALWDIWDDLVCLYGLYSEVNAAGIGKASALDGIYSFILKFKFCCGFISWIVRGFDVKYDKIGDEKEATGFSILNGGP